MSATHLIKDARVPLSRAGVAQCHDTMGCVLNSTGPELVLQLEALRSTARQLAQLYQLSEKKKVRNALTFV